MIRRCEFSHCRRYRFTLWRDFEAQGLALEPPARGRGSFLAVIGLNPSTADETRDDPTIRRCIRFAQAWGFGALAMLNAFGWRDTDPAGMKAAADPVGAENDRWILECAKGAGLILAAWGTHGSHLNRAAELRELLAGFPLYCLGTTADGSPRHPLYIRKDFTPERWETR